MGKGQGSPISPTSSFFLLLCGAQCHRGCREVLTVHLLSWEGELLTRFPFHKLWRKDWGLDSVLCLPIAGGVMGSSAWRSLRLEIVIEEWDGVEWGGGFKEGSQSEFLVCLEGRSSHIWNSLFCDRLWAVVTVDKLGTGCPACSWSWAVGNAPPWKTH